MTIEFTKSLGQIFLEHPKDEVFSPDKTLNDSLGPINSFVQVEDDDAEAEFPFLCVYHFCCVNRVLLCWISEDGIPVERAQREDKCS